MGIVYITPKGNLFIAEEGLCGEEFDKVVIELFGKEELQGDNDER